MPPVMGGIVQERGLGESRPIQNKDAKQGRSDHCCQSPEASCGLWAALDTCANCRHRLLTAI